MAGDAEDALDEARERLYALPPEEFTAARGALVRALRSAGNRGDAASVQKLRRPSVAAWSVNQAARADQHRVERLFAAGSALTEAHGDASWGSTGGDVRSATQRRRALVDELTDAALAFAASVSPNAETHRDAIAATWEAASIEPDVQAAVAGGWLDRELPRPSGFGVSADMLGKHEEVDRAPGARRRLPSRRADAAPRDELAVRRAQAALETAEDEVATTGEALAAAERELAAARTEADATSQRVDTLEAELHAARAAARESARAVQAAEKAESRARTGRDRAQRRLEQARQHRANQD
jgi:hypothetical protein